MRLGRAGAAIGVVLGLLFAVRVHAHQDARLRLSATGEVLGLPARFGRVAIEGLGATKAGPVAIRIGPHTVTLPRCVDRVLAGLKPRSLRAGGSWHEDGDALSYVWLDLPKIRVEGQDVTQVRFLFDLVHGTLLKVQGTRGDALFDLDASCTAAEQRQLAPSGGPSTPPLSIEEPWANRASVVLEATYVDEQVRGPYDLHPLLRVDRMLKGELGSSRIVFDGLDPLPNELMPAELHRGRRYRVYLAPTDDTRAINAKLPAKLPPAFYQPDTIAVVDLDRTPGEENARRAQLARYRGLESYELTAVKWRSLRARRSLDYDEVARVFHALQKLVQDLDDADEAHALLGAPDEREVGQSGVAETYFLNPLARKDPAPGEVLARIELFYASRYNFAPLHYAESFQVFRGKAFQDGPYDELRARGVEWVTITRHLPGVSPLADRVDAEPSPFVDNGAPSP